MTQKSKSKRAVSLIPQERIENKIYLIRGKKVMLDRDLATLYDVPTKSLNLAVKRNSTRFPGDFMFRLTSQEYSVLRFQFETSKKGSGGSRYLPYAFTEHGILMLSSVLNSERAVQVNIQIIRTFTKLRELMISHKDLARKMDQLDRKFKEHDKSIALVFEALKEILEDSEDHKKKKSPIGFHTK